MEDPKTLARRRRQRIERQNIMTDLIILATLGTITLWLSLH